MNIQRRIIMNKHAKSFRVFTGLVLGSLVIGLVSAPVSDAAKKASLKTKKFNLTVGQKKQIQIKNKKKKAVYSFISNKKAIASVTKKGVVQAKKAGNVKITVKEKYKKKTKKVGTVQIQIKQKAKPVQSPNPTPSAPAVTAAPPVNVTTSPDPVVTPTPDPTPTPIPTLPPREDDDNYDTPKGFDQKKSGVTYGTLTTIHYDSRTTGARRTANVILPAGYSDEEEYPVLYLLHGIGGDHTEWLGSNPVQVIGNLIAEEMAPDMIVVMPNVRAREDDKGNPGDIYSPEHFKAFDNFINDLRDDLMPYMKANYSIAEGRANTAIAGLSMGGREALYIGITMPYTFGYIGGFEPAVGVLPYDREEGLFTEDTLKLPEEYNDRTYIMICKGENDGTVGDAPVNYHNALTKNGTPHDYYVIPDVGHDHSAWKNGLYNFVRRIF